MPRRLPAALATALLVPLMLAFLVPLAGCPPERGEPGGDAGTPALDGGADGPAGPQLVFHVRTSTAPFPHADGLAGQTARDAWQGIRSLHLLRAPDDSAPVLVFDHGDDFVEAGYNDGDDTIVGRAALASIPAGVYVRARIGVTHSRYTVASTLHVAGAAIPGDYDCLQALSDRTTLDGQVRALGWYRYTFLTAGHAYPTEGSNAPLPLQPETGGFTMKTFGGQTVYDVDAALAVDPSVGRDVAVIADVNMDHSFRWQDEALPGYLPGVYDTTPTSFEPVWRFGANSFALSLE
ncbi:MAG TPA: hypothetical protein VGQ83_30685 [Polyangia bacterium]|jgi:hypothetical protein